MALTDTALKNLKPLATQYKKADGGGLYLLVKPNGTKLWRLDYRFFGTRKTLAVGQYPAVSLSAARAAREAAKALLAKDLDPGAEKKQAKLVATISQENTFDKAVDAYLENMVKRGRAAPTIEKNTWMLKELSKPLARRPIADIKPIEIANVIKHIEARGVVYSAIQTRATISRVFQLAIAKGQIEIDPTPSMKGALKQHVTESYPGLTEPADVGGLMRAVQGYDGWPQLGAALRLQAYCFARPGETRTLEWDELDLKGRIWSIPASKSKLRRPQDVPLSDQAMDVIESMRPLNGDQKFVFKSMMKGKDILSENSMNSALRRMGYNTQEQHCAHGFRTTASTLLNVSGKFREDAIEAQLAHLDPNRTRRTYNRTDYWDERVPMMQWYADYLDALAEKTTSTGAGDAI